jgi:hypothetical protein
MKLKKTLQTAILTLVIGALAGSLSAEDAVRADFQNEDQYAASGGVFGDDGAGIEGIDEFSCLGPGIPESFDFVDWRDDAEACIASPGATPASDGVLSITWGKGRWKLQTGPDYVRAVGLNFSDVLGAGQKEKDALCSQLDGLEFPVGGEVATDPYEGTTCGCGGACTALATFGLDSVFKRGVNRQDVSFPVRLESGRPALLVDYVNPLYVCVDLLDSSDSNVRYLQTDSCEGDDSPSVAEAEVFEVRPEGGGAEVLIGRWNMPLKVRLRRVPIVDTSDGGGGGNTCTLAQKGETCTGNSNCCSGKCGGKPGKKTCK